MTLARAIFMELWGPEGVAISGGFAAKEAWEESGGWKEMQAHGLFLFLKMGIRTACSWWWYSPTEAHTEDVGGRTASGEISLNYTRVSMHGH